MAGRKGRSNDITHLKKEAFLAAYRLCGNVSVAAKEAGIDRGMFYYWLKNDPDFPAQAKEAEEAAVERLEAEVLRRAVQGVTREKGIYYKGKKVGKETITEFSDLLLIFLLKARAPKKYRENLSISMEKEITDLLDKLKTRLPKEVYAQVLNEIANIEDRT